jgi:hypothetical protein
MPPVRATRGRRRALGAAAALACVLASLASACGDDSNAGLSQQRASNLRSTLDQVEARVQDRDCTGAAQQADALREQVDALPSRVDRDLRVALERSSERLESLVADQCEPETAPAVEAPPAEETPAPDPNSGDQQDQGKKDKKPKKEKQPADEQPPPDTGGTGQEGSTGVTGQDGGTSLPGGGG